MADNDDYYAKLKSLKKYVPFLVNMMADLKNKGNREAQLNKIQSLHDMITDDKKKLKLETLNRCEEVLTNIYIKVNPQIKNKSTLAPTSPGQPIEVPDSPPREVDETPRSPSPDPDYFDLACRPVTIPTEKVHEKNSKKSKYGSSRNRNIPKIDIYGAAAFDILLLDKKRQEESPPPAGNVPDISKPPISLDDLRNLEDDVQDKMTAVHLTTRPIDELEKYKRELEMQLRVDDINRTLSSYKALEINTTVRNKLDLSHIKKAKEAKSASSKSSKSSGLKNDSDSPKSNRGKDEKSSSSNKERGRTKDEKSSSDNREKSKEYKKDSSKEKSKKDDKKDKDKEKSKDKKSDHKDKDKKRDSSKDSRDRSRDRKRESSSNRCDSKKKDDDNKKVSILGRDSVTADLKTRLFSSLKTDEGSQSSLDSSSSKDNKIEINKPQGISKKEPRKSFEEQLVAPEQTKTFKRLADKYNPKPKKPSSDDFDKLVSKSIEKSMKISPAKVPDIFEKIAESTNVEEQGPTVTKMTEPTPPPASLVRLALNKPSPEPEKPKPVQLPEILQKIFQKANKPAADLPKDVDLRTETRNDPRTIPADPRRRNDAPKPPLLSRDPMSHIDLPPPKITKEVGPPILSPPLRNIPSVLSPSQHNTSQTFMPPKSLLPTPNQTFLAGGRFQSPNIIYPAISTGLDFIPASPMVDFACLSPRVDFEIPPSPNVDAQHKYIPPDFLENPVRPPFQNVSFLREQFPNENMTQMMFGSQANQLDHGNAYEPHHFNQYDLHNQSVNFYQVNSYNNLGGMPVLQPELPHLMAEPKPYLPEPTPFYNDRGWNDNMRHQRSWRDDRRPGDPRNYREYREKREKEERERRDRQKERDPRMAKDPKNDAAERGRSKDSRNVDERERGRSKSRGRRERSKDREPKEAEKEKPQKSEKSKFDKIYSKTNRDRSSSKSGSEDEVFISPLDSLYSGKEDKRTGRGYGMQNFRIPKKRSDDRFSKNIREKTRGKETEKRPVRRIESDDEENDGDNLSDTGAPCDNDALSDHENVEKDPVCEKEVPKQAKVKETSDKRNSKDSVIEDNCEEIISDDDVVVVKDEKGEEKKNKRKQQEAEKKKQQAAIEKVKKTLIKQKILKPKKESIIKIEESESEEVIEIKDEEHEERKKSLRKKPVKQQSPVVSPTKRQPARKAKKISIPLPITIKQESEDEVEEITTESEVIDVEDDEETQREIEELEASQIAKSAKETEEPVIPPVEAATSEEMELFVSEYVLEVTGDVDKCLTPIEMNIKQEYRYDTGKEISKNNSVNNQVDTESKSKSPKKATRKSRPKSPKKSSSIEEEALKRIALINKLTKPAEVVVAETVELETEADAAAKELSEFLETPLPLETSPIKPTSKEPTESHETGISTTVELSTPMAVSPIIPTLNEPTKTTQPTTVKALEVEIQEPTSSQDEPKTANEVCIEKENTETCKSAEISSHEIENSTELSKTNEILKEPESSKKSEESAEPSEPNILAHFFENLLKSNNKQDKKTALISLIQTFSDSFTDKELSKITKIIRVDPDDENSDEDSSKKDELEKNEAKEETEQEKDEKAPEEEEAPVVGSTTEEEVPPIKLKIIRRLSSTTEEENQDCDTSGTKPTQDHSPPKDKSESTETSSKQPVEEPVLVSVGERIKNRKRNMPPSTKGKKHKTELDRIHEDIKEMFIRDGVLTATGKRMTRMLKDDPNALSPTKSTEASAQTSKHLRKKSGSKSKYKDESGKLKDVRIVLSKMPDHKFKIQTKRALRSNTSFAEDDNATESNESEGSDSESSDSSESDEEEEDKKSHKSESNQPKKPLKKRMKSAWALGIIKKSKKKPAHLKSKENSPERVNTPDIDNNASLEEDLDKLFVEPDKNYYYNANIKNKLTCKLCDFTGMFITTHYLKEHPHSEVLCSRFAPEMAKDAKKDYQYKKKRYDAIVNKRLALKYNYSCRFCGYTSQTQPIFFYEHCSTHTGEYRHQCGICHFYSVTGKTLNQHFLNAHPGKAKNAVRETYTKAVIYGYICGECNYVQLKEKAVEEHVNIYHLGEKPKIYKINMSKIMDPALEDSKTDLIYKPAIEEIPKSEPAPLSVKEQDFVKPKNSEKEIDDEEDIVQPQKKVKKAVKKAKKEAEESVTDSDVSEQKNPPEPPKIRRKAGPKSKTRPLEVSTPPPEIPSEVETETEDHKIITPPPVRRKPGPKSKTRKQPIMPVEMSESDNQPEPETTDSETNKEHHESSTSEDQNIGPRPAKILKKRRSLEALICKENGEDLDTVIALSSRSSRAAKEKASKHIKLFIESNEGSPRKLKALQRKSIEAKESEKEIDNLVSTEKEEDKAKKNDTNVFTCKPDNAQEENNIREERLKKMEELNKSLCARSSKLDFVEKLSNRLTNEDTPSVKIKEEPKDLDTSLERPETPMPVLEKEVPTGPVQTPEIPIPPPSSATPPGRKSLIKPKTLDGSSPITSVNVNLRSNSLFPDIIQKLQGKVGQPQESTSDLNEHIQIGNLIKATRQGSAVVFSCHAANCYVSTKDRIVFQLHCKFGHRDISVGEACLCDKCGVNVTSTRDTTLMENLYDHLMYAHSDFIDTSSKPKMLRMRRLSGDKLSIKHEEEEAAAAAAETVKIKQEKVDQEPVREPEETPVPMDTTTSMDTTAPMDTSVPPTNEPATSSDNPFTFKIAEVMSLATDAQLSPQKQNVAQTGSPQKQSDAQQKLPQVLTHSPRSAPLVVQQPPPLTLISSKTPTQHQLVIKEAKLTQAELNKPRKAPKAMTKFVETPGDLYKCPHYYCLFTTNFRAFLERHLKAHKSDTEVMIPCVYCDMKTPWEHVPMHIDIRHAHCRFACSFCLYRSWLKEYVCLHQDSQHPGVEYSVVQLPQHKAAKKFSVADLKIDPRTLCEPFRCICSGVTTKEYLYENEFDQHIKKFHAGTMLRCGYRGCTTKCTASLMINHWASFHGISTYQCGYCKMSSKEMMKMYVHFSQFHQWMGPDILVRIGDYVLDINKELGYSPEAFDRLAHITNLPGNVLTANRSKGTKAVKLVHLPNATAQLAPSVSATTTDSVAAFTVDSSNNVATLTTHKTATSPTIPPPMTSLINTATTGGSHSNIQLIVAASTSEQTTPSSLYFVPTTTTVAPSDSTVTLHASENVKSPPKIVSVTKPPANIVTDSSLSALKLATPEQAISTVLQRSTDIELATMRTLMCPNVTVVSTKHSILSRNNSPVVSKLSSRGGTLTLASKTEDVKSKEVITSLPPGISLTSIAPSTAGANVKEPVLPPSISLLKVIDTNKKTNFVDAPDMGHGDRSVEGVEKSAGEIEASKGNDLETPSPILLPDPDDENSLDEPLFDNIDVNTDSPVEDPLSIEPTIAAIPLEDPIAGEPSEDPLSVPTAQDPLTSEVANVPGGGPPRVRRTVSNVSNSDDETNQDKTGLQGYQLYRCAICSISFSNATDFRQHITQSLRCRKEGKIPFQCVHCEKRIKTSVKLLQHIHIHGVLRYSCSLCSMKFAISYTAKMHMKNRHQISQSKIIPVIAGKTNSETDSFILRPLSLQPPAGSKERPSSGRDSATDSPSKSGGEDMIFMPDNIDGIPIRQIFTQNAKCGLCNYQTKVRVNILRHLQMHSDDKWVPDTAPVNPVPCLEKNEKMFDKMINLASSSMEGRMGGTKEKDEEKLPEYVPSHCRFICCAQGCTYLCLEESNLRHHIMALHSDDLDFDCGHCKSKIEPPDVESVLKHLKLHSLHLYKCKYCAFVHNLKHKVERHVSDAHADLPVKVVTVRNMDVEQENERSLETIKETSVNKTRPWKCCFCKYTTTTEDLCKNHILVKHNLDCQFKCGLCSYKSDEKQTFYHHFQETHPRNELDIISVYQYFEDELPKEDDPHVDTTPLWQRDKARVRHIRGILLDESSPQPIITKSPKNKGPKPGPSGNKSSNSKNLFDVPFGTSKPSNTSRNLFDSGALSISNSKNLSDAIDSVARGGGELINFNEESSLKKVVRMQNEVVKRAHHQKEPTKTVVERDPLKLSAGASTLQNVPSKNLPMNVVADAENEAPPILTNIDGENDVKEILPTFEEINKVKQGLDDPIIIIDDDDDDEIIAAKPIATEIRGKKRGGGTTDLLQEALKMAKLDEMDRTDVDEDGIPIAEYSEENLKNTFGELGGPNNRQWKCPLCLQFRSKRISDFIFHIFKDLNVFRYRCKSCKDESITFKYMIGHIKTHFEPLTEDDIETLPPNNKLEAWIQMVLREQSIVISNNIQNLSKPVALVDENIPCMFCSDRFVNAAEASEHMLKHWITKPYLCMYCPNDFNTRFELRYHQTTSHTNLKQVLNNISPTVSEAMHRFDDGFRKRPLSFTNPDFPVAKKMKFSGDTSVSTPNTNTINIVSVNDILNKGNVLEEPGQQSCDLSEPSTSIAKSSTEDKNTISIDSDEELVMVTKTDEFIPNDDEVYACLMCAFVTDRGQTVTEHLETVTKHLEMRHGSRNVARFKVLNRKQCEISPRYMACNVCHQVFPELKLRLHFMENHQERRCAYAPYVFTCNICSGRFTLLRSMKSHFSSKHQHMPMEYKTIDGYAKSTAATGTVAKNAKKVTADTTTTTKGTRVWLNAVRSYRCVFCEFSSEARTPNPMRTHVKSIHFKPVECNICRERFRTEAEAVGHHRKCHDIDSHASNTVLDVVLKEYLETMRLIIKMSTPVETDNVEKDSVKNDKKTARKSTGGSPQIKKIDDSTSTAFDVSVENLISAALASIQPPNDTESDISKLKTAIFVDGSQKDISVKELKQFYNLETYVDLSESRVSD